MKIVCAREREREFVSALVRVHTYLEVRLYVCVCAFAHFPMCAHVVRVFAKRLIKCRKKCIGNVA